MVRPGTAGLGMGGGRYVSYEHVFWLIADPRDQVVRLYEIELPTNADAARDVLGALSDSSVKRPQRKPRRCTAVSAPPSKER
jgi:hypothetical protein